MALIRSAVQKDFEKDVLSVAMTADLTACAMVPLLDNEWVVVTVVLTGI